MESLQLPQKTSGPAIASLVLGILALFTFALTSLPAIICGHIARAGIRKGGGQVGGGRLALAGLILGYLSVIAVVVVITSTAIFWTQKTVVTNDTNVADFAQRAALVIPASATPSDYKWMPGMDSMAQLRLEMPTSDLDEFLRKSNLEGELRNTTRTASFKAVYGDFLHSTPTKFREGQKSLPSGEFLNVLIDEDAPDKVIVYVMWFET